MISAFVGGSMVQAFTKQCLQKTREQKCLGVSGNENHNTVHYSIPISFSFYA